MIDWLLGFVVGAGYTGIFIAMVLVFSFIPFPSQVVLLPAGYLASQGEMSLFWVLFSGTLGGVVGVHISYYLANKLGRGVILRYGKYVFIKEDSLRKVEQFFDKYGQLSITIGLITPGVGQLITLPAGLAAMHRVKFFFSAVAGAFMWNTAMVLIGYFFGDNKEAVTENLETILMALVFTIIVVVLIYLKFKKPKVEDSSN